MPRLEAARHGRRLFGGGVAVALVALTVVVGQTAPATSTVYVAVSDTHGRPVTGLTAADFTVAIDDVPVQVVGAHPATDPITLAVILSTDRNETLLVRDTLAAVTTALRAVPGSREGLTRWQDGTVAFDPVGATGDPLVAAITSRFPDPVDIEPGIVGSAQALGREATPRRAVLVVNRMGIDTIAHALPVTETLRETGTSLWAVNLVTRYEDRLEPYLATLAPVTGGQSETLLTASALPAVTRDLMAHLTSQYVVTYASPTPVGDQASLSVGVRRTDVRVSAPAWAR